MMRQLLVMYTLDPRGAKVGGIETHVRQVLSRHPEDFEVIFVGIDEIGDLVPGLPVPLRLGARQITFIPVARVPSEAVNVAAKKLWHSTTLRYVLGCLRHFSTIRGLLDPRRASADLHRFEFAWLARLFGLRAVQMVHGEGSKADAMDSLIKKFWFVHALNEKIALTLAARILCVNGSILKRYDAEFPRARAKAEEMSVPVDTDTFRPTPFQTQDDTLRLAFAGRLDAFKDPALMFRTLAVLKERLQGRVEFHYVGASDPEKFPEFAAIRSITIRHGFLRAPEVAAVLARCHAGIMTSFFEGMPCFLLETLASGRPFGAIALPQFAPLLIEGCSGFLVPRAESVEGSAAAMADGFIDLWSRIRAGAMSPETVAGHAAPYAIGTQMERLFDIHRALTQRHQPDATIRPARA